MLFVKLNGLSLIFIFNSLNYHVVKDEKTKQKKQQPKLLELFKRKYPMSTSSFVDFSPIHRNNKN